MIEEVESRATPVRRAAPNSAPTAVPLSEVGPAVEGRRPTGVGELDRVLGGGFVTGSVSLLSGEPGVGKSTLILQVLMAAAASGRDVLLATAEESAEQVRLRAERLGALPSRLLVVADTVLPDILSVAREVRPDIFVVDSIQTVYDPELESAPGSVSQVREGAGQIVRLAKQEHMTTVLVGHVTKEGVVAGPRVLEHLVDTVLSFEGETDHALRLLRATKNRFGSTGEIGIFEMAEAGLVALADPSGVFLADRRAGAADSVVACVLAGHRPLLVEVQALVTDSSAPIPRRSFSGLDGARVGLLAGLLEKRLRFPFGKRDIYAQAAGGVRLTEPGSDLAIALALVSAETEIPITSTLVAVAEVGLAGELRRVSGLRRRLSEAVRLGFSHAIVPSTVEDSEIPPGVELLRMPDLASALRVSGLPAGTGA